MVTEEDRTALRMIFLAIQEQLSKVFAKLGRLEVMDSMLEEATVTSSNQLRGLSNEKNSSRQQLLREQERLSPQLQQQQPH
jgi:hypothetical protein